MIYTMFAYRDIETEKFNPPFLVPFSIEDTIESVKDGAIKGKIESAKTFELFYLGTFDTIDAGIKLVDPKKVLTLSDYVKE